MIYFISGHRDITRAEFEYWYVPIIKNAVERDKHARFVLGGCEGVDSMALEYLDELAFNPDRVTIYYNAKETKYLFTCNSKGFDSYEEADQNMTKDSDIDIAFIRPGKEDSYTAKNILRRYLMK